MSKSIGILYVAPEANPFVKNGSFAEIAGSFPKSVKALGHDIRVMLPGYACINSRRFQIHNLLRMKNIDVPVGDSNESAYIKSSYLNSDNHKVQVYFLANDRFFSRDGLYFHPETKKYFPDNDERFIFFCRGVLETLKRLQWQPQIIHCNDWQSGLIPMYLKTIYKDDPYFKNVRTIFTAYNLASHGTFPKSSIAKTGMPSGLFNTGGEDDGRLNFLQAGLTYADIVTTMGVKAERGISLSGPGGNGKPMLNRKQGIVAMNTDNHNGNGKELLAGQFIDVYRDLVKNN
jgi:starch synthase